jgi:phage terminase large subunit-like protein
MLEQFYKYIDNVLSGQELVSETTKLTVLRHLNDLERSKGEDYPFYFDEKEAAKAIAFLRALRHPSGDHGIAGKRFNVQDNQAFITGCLFGWRDKETKLRRFTEVYFEVPRKWGKSLYAAFVQIYVGFYEGVKGAGVFTAATTRDQADEVFRAAQSLCRYLIQDSATAKKHIRVLANSIIDLKSECFIQKVSADAGNLDGKNPVCVVLDEKHAHKNDLVREVMVSGQATWKCPMLFTITTAGFNKEGPCFKVDRPNAIGVLKGERKDEHLFAMIFCHDTDDADGILNLDPDDPEQAKEILRLAKKSNPNLGSTPDHKFILGRVREARNKGGSARVGVLTKNFNCWLDTPEIWIPEETVKAAMRPMTLEEFKGRPCYVGIDLAATKDITAAAFFFPAYGEMPAAIITRFWLPEETVKKRQEDTNYLDWVHSGHIVTTPGNVADYQHIRNYLNEAHGVVNIQAVTIDQWNSVQISTDIQGDGFTIQLCRQSYGNLSEPSKWLEKAVLQGNVELNDNPVLLWMFRNVVLDYDANDNIKPNKEKSADKIDGVAASVMAIFGWLTKPQEQTSYLLSEDSDVLII